MTNTHETTDRAEEGSLLVSGTLIGLMLVAILMCAAGHWWLGSLLAGAVAVLALVMGLCRTAGYASERERF